MTIIVKLKGGLGNQLFQYAAAKRLAVYHNADLKLDLSYLRENKLRPYQLSNFQIRAHIASEKETRRLGGIGYGRIGQGLFKLRQLHRQTLYREKHFHFDPNVLTLPDNTYLDGYWQSEKYFCDIKDAIREEVKVIREPQGKNKELAEKITSVESVSLHVRRGDYVRNPVTHAFHGLCSMDYYLRSIGVIAEKIESPHFFIFSDDIQWVQKNLIIPHPTTYMTHNGEKGAHEDLRLMSSCKHHIAANSSFSWWGAWLNPSSEKIAIVPSKWFNRDDMDTRDLTLNGWIRL